MKKILLSLLLGLFYFLSVVAQDLPPAIVWQKCLGGSIADIGTAMLQMENGNYLVAGHSYSQDWDKTCYKSNFDLWLTVVSPTGQLLSNKCYGGQDVDRDMDIIHTPDGGFMIIATTESLPNTFDVIGNHGMSDVWLVKLDKNLNIQWKRCYGGTKAETGNRIILDPAGGYIFVGSTASGDGDVIGNPNSGGGSLRSIWLVKIDDNGNIVWQKCLGSTGRSDNANSLVRTADGGLVISGSTASAAPPNSWPGYHGATDMLVIKTSADGTIEWSKCYGGSGIESAGYLVKDNDGGYLLTGSTTSSDGDVGMSLGIGEDGWLAKLSSNGSIVWSKVFGGSKSDNPRSILVRDTTIYVLGSSSSLDPSSTGAWLLSFQKNGTMNWQKIFGSPLSDGFKTGMFTSDNELLLLGYTQANGGDVSGYHPGSNLEDYWLVRVGDYNTIKGKVYIDRNRNGTKEVEEPLYKEAILRIQKGNNDWVYFAKDGSFLHTVSPGQYTTSVHMNKPYYTVVPPSHVSNFPGFFATDSMSFALQPIPGIRDFGIDLFSISPFRPGFDVTYKIKISNLGTDTLVNKTIRMVKDTRLLFLSASPAPTSVINDTLIWTTGTLLPEDTSYITIEMRVPNPPIVGITDRLISRATIDTTGDIALANNSSEWRHQVVGSFDPNDKKEAGAGILYKSEYDQGKWLQYNIRFQNTGTDTAFTVEIKDTLDAKLDWSSIEMIGASHSYQLLIKQGNYCSWKFSNILLPDSNRNEALSHGYIAYRIKPKTSLSLGDTIRNSASIYFDFNLPVKTNVEETIIKPTPVPAPQQPVVTGLVNGYCSNQGGQQGRITNLPSTGTTVEVKLDATVLVVGADSSFSFSVTGLSQGMHAITVKFSNDSGSKTTTHNFTVTTAIAPDVNVISNITTIINLVDPVIVTANNTSGGGTAPLYTFGKERTFGNLWQAEGASSTLTIAPLLLTLGDNWVYVRMKSSAGCVTINTAIDSIKLVRDMMTGITDPDNPGKVISLYPNPFNKQAYISGLSAGKSYMISITNLNGQLIQQKRISNRTNTELLLQTNKSGTYLLTIYDEKKKLSLGTIKIIKQ